MGVKLADQVALRDFLHNEKVAALAVPIDAQGTLHIATMNYLHLENPLRLYFLTSGKSEKCRLLNIEPVQAACNVGAYSGTPFTLQMRGTARILGKTQYAAILPAYLRRRGTSDKHIEGPDAVLVEFVPDWARFTDYSKGWDNTILEV